MFQVNIQFLRAVAALLVFMFHLAPHLGPDGYLFSNIIGFFRQFGYAGVDVFFVISGYVIWVSSQAHSGKSPQHFIYNRFSRIYLGYWPYFLIFLAMVYFFTPQRLATTNLAGSLFLIPVTLPHLLLQVSWTLTYELYFYVCFTALLFLPRNFLPKAIVLLALLIISIQGYQIMVHDIYSVDKLVFMDFYLSFLTSPLCLEFLLGCLIAVYFENNRIQNLWLLVVLTITVAIGALWYQNQFIPNGLLSQGYYLPQRVMFFGTVAALLLCIFVELNKRAVIFFNKPSQLLGGASYSIYLAHIPVLFLFNQLGVFTYMRTSSMTQVFILILTVLTVLTYSVFHYLCVEKPLMKGSKLLWKKIQHHD